MDPTFWKLGKLMIPTLFLLGKIFKNDRISIIICFGIKRTKQKKNNDFNFGLIFI